MRSVTIELVAGAGIGAGFGIAAISIERGNLALAVFFGLWGAVLTLLVALGR